jgi:hypothetical protein
MVGKIMANNFEWFQKAVSNLSNDDLNKAPILSEFKLAICALPSAEQKLIVSKLKLENVFDCLNSSET